MSQDALHITGAIPTEAEHILNAQARQFVTNLAREFAPRVKSLLQERQTQQARYDAGELPDFLKQSDAATAGDWKVAPLPADLQDRRVEITGPVSRKMVINALNSGARVFMADFEDSSSPTWHNMLDGQRNLYDAVRGTIAFEDPNSGKHYALGDSPAVLMARPRGWHLPERHVQVDGEAVPGSLFDFGLYFFHNAKTLLERGSGPYFYLPKLQSHLEAKLWNDVFVWAQDTCGVPQGSVRATVLIETLPAAFQMDEILYALRDHSAGLNCGRWDYIFSFIKVQRAHSQALLPDRGEVGMTQPFMRAYSQLTIKTCHRRGAAAMGGMATQIPIKNDPTANDAAFAKVRADKEREAGDGHDGTWVAHPGLVALAYEAFDAAMDGPNQIAKTRDDVNVGREELLAVPTGHRTEDGLRQNVSVGIQYLEAWLGGLGCVPLYNLMEDAATAEISRTQLWQWVRHRAKLDNGSDVTAALISQVADEELAKVPTQTPKLRERARNLFQQLVENETLEDFLTLPAYDQLVAHEDEEPA